MDDEEPKSPETPEESQGEQSQTQENTLEESSQRKRSREDESEDEDEPASKIHKAYLSLSSPQLVEDAIHDQEFNLDLESPLGWAMTSVGVPSQKKVIPTPSSYSEAVGDPEWGHLWKEAVENEITALASNRTWEVTTLPKGRNLVTSKWVFNVKYHPDGRINKFKARLVARGFSQIWGIDFDDTFAPTVRHDTIRTFMAVICLEDWELHQVDVNNAFTESILKEDIYMQAPQGVHVHRGEVLHLLKSLYGLKQAAKDWHHLCKTELIKMGFSQSDADPCLFVHRARRLMVLVYVDDITIGAKDLQDVTWFKKSFRTVFKIKDLGEASHLLGVRISRDRTAGTLRLDQTHYVDEVLQKLHMSQETARPTKSPMDSYSDLRVSGSEDLRVDKTHYQEGVGRWMYLGILTRPDIAFSLGRLSQYLADPAEHHASALKKLGRYCRSSRNLGICFSQTGGPYIEGYSDSDYAMDKADRVSILGNVFMLAGAPISWASKKQKSVASSTMEAEYMAMARCAKQSQFLAQILRDMNMGHHIGPDSFKPNLKEAVRYSMGSPAVQLRGDNQAALKLAKDAQVSERSKHIDIAFHFQRHLVKMGRIAVEFVKTTDMIADGLTKLKTGPAFEQFVRQLNLN